MCDTIVAPPSCTAEDALLFGKNSDRQRNEAQAVECFPRADHARDAQLSCTYITIPQVLQTHAVLLCRPFWIWGAEMGANEHGVVIGNEGLNARVPAQETEALTGMDLVRLALERAATATEALKVMTTLLERHGQGGNCWHLKPSFYNNGFIVADPSTAFVLETVGREWLVTRVRDAHAISNGYTIRTEAERTSAGLAGLVRELGWSGNTPIDYAHALANRETEQIGQADSRRARSTALLAAEGTQLRVEDFMRILRDHGAPDDPDARRDPRTAVKYGLCIHAASEAKSGQTTAAMVSQIRQKDSVHWVTGTAAPCTSIFKPVLFDVPLPYHGPTPNDRFDPKALWWRHEQLHRGALMGDFPHFLEQIRDEREALEALFRGRVKDVLNGGTRQERSRVIAECWQAALEMEGRWLAQLPGRPVTGVDTSYRESWSRMNGIAGIEALT